MKKNLWVISLGGSRIIPDDVDYEFLERFKSLIKKNKNCKFVIVTGGGSTARRYIKALRSLNRPIKNQSLAGIQVTRLHARLMARFFGKIANEKDIPINMKKVKNLLKKNQVVFCGALRYQKKNTSDGTAAKLAGYLNCSFINLTNIDGLYNKNPKTNKNAKKISKISWKEFDKIASKIKYKAGQHFVLDQNASKKILKEKIPTYIVGKTSEIDNILKGKKFKGTLICG